MIPVLTPDEMVGVDGAAPEPVDVLVARAGAAVARAAAGLLCRPSSLGRVYGARVVVVAGPGNNGADGRDAARRLARRGARVLTLDASEVSGDGRLPDGDLVIDAAFGTGLSRPYRPPPLLAGTPVLGVDIPSGLSGLTGEVVGGDERGSVQATRTVTFAALKPGLLLGSGPSAAGEVEVADIGLGPGVEVAARAWSLTDDDVAGIPDRPHEAHKWQAAVHVVAGSPGMNGAPWLAGRAAMRTGAGYVRLGMPGVEAGGGGLPPGELVHVGLPDDGWERDVLKDLDRFACLVVGPGLGATARSPGGGTGPDTPVGRLVAAAPVPVIVDADGLNALGSLEAVAEVAGSCRHPVVLTPHAGELTRLAGAPPGADRIASVRDAARRSRAVVLLKGSTTVVADPEGWVLLVDSGSSRLATAGTGDVLSGVIGALVARGVPPREAAALGAHVHGRAAELGPSDGLVASDLPELISEWLSSNR